MNNELRENTGDAAKEIIVRLERLQKRTSGTETENDIKTAGRAFVEAKNILKDFDFKNESPDNIARLTNAWTAWKADGVFKDSKFDDLRGDLQKMLPPEGSPDYRKKEYRYIRQIWRTDIVNYFMDRIKDRPDKDEVMVKIMEAQIVNDPPAKAIATVKLDGVDKTKLAADMENGKSCFFKDIPKEFEGKVVTEIKVVTGGAFLTIPLEYAQKFEFKNMVADGDTIYAQMKNGCEGNFVVIQFGPPPEKPPFKTIKEILKDMNKEPPEKETPPKKVPPKDVPGGEYSEYNYGILNDIWTGEQLEEKLKEIGFEEVKGVHDIKGENFVFFEKGKFRVGYTPNPSDKDKLYRGFVTFDKDDSTIEIIEKGKLNDLTHELRKILKEYSWTHGGKEKWEAEHGGAKPRRVEPEAAGKEKPVVKPSDVPATPSGDGKPPPEASKPTSPAVKAAPTETPETETNAKDFAESRGLKYESLAEAKKNTHIIQEKDGQWSPVEGWDWVDPNPSRKNYATEEATKYPTGAIKNFEDKWGISIVTASYKKYSPYNYNWAKVRKQMPMIDEGMGTLNAEYPRIKNRMAVQGIKLKLAQPSLINDTEDYNSKTKEIQFDWNDNALKVRDGIVDGLDDSGILKRYVDDELALIGKTHGLFEFKTVEGKKYDYKKIHAARFDLEKALIAVKNKPENKLFFEKAKEKKWGIYLAEGTRTGVIQTGVVIHWQDGEKTMEKTLNEEIPKFLKEKFPQKSIEQPPPTKTDAMRPPPSRPASAPPPTDTEPMRPPTRSTEPPPTETEPMQPPKKRH